MQIPRLLLGLLALLLFCHVLVGQTNEETEVAEPIFRDNTTDIGSEAGSIELNYLPFWQRNEAFQQSTHGVEVEYTIISGLGIEAECAVISFAPKSGNRDTEFGNLELGMQYTLWQNEKTALALGSETEFSVQGDADFELAPFATLALLWSERWSSQIGISPEISFDDSDLELSFQGSLLCDLSWGLGGFELLAQKEEDDFYLAFAPQLSWYIGDFTIGAGIAASIIAEEGQQTSFLLRLIYEIEDED